MANMSEDDVALRANQLTDESLESTRRMLQMTEESQQTGVNTLVMLDQQGEQLDRINEGVDEINQNMKQAERNLNEMAKCCGLCLCPCDRVKTDKRYKRACVSDEMASARPKGAVVSSQPSGIRNGQPGQQGDSGPYIKRITNDAREDEMEENLIQVGSLVSNMRNIAEEMGREISSQNQKIDHITEKVSLTGERVENADKRAKKLG